MTNKPKIKLNIGSSDLVLNGYINIDNGLDYGSEDKMQEAANQTAKDMGIPEQKILFQDANDLSNFGTETVDHIHSNQCIGSYVTNYKELARVLKIGGTIYLGVWAFAVSNVIAGLSYYGVKITSVSLFNSCIEDVGSEDTTWTLCIKGTKVSNSPQYDVPYDQEEL